MAEDQYYYAVGRRKTSSAQVRLYPGGEGNITVNGKPYDEYFSRLQDWAELKSPLEETGHDEDVDITVLVNGGGITGQSGAIKHAIARALVEFNEDLRTVLRRGGYLTRDPRMKERKKPGLKRARKAPTYTKR